MSGETRLSEPVLGRRQPRVLLSRGVDSVSGVVVDGVGFPRDLRTLCTVTMGDLCQTQQGVLGSSEGPDRYGFFGRLTVVGRSVPVCTSRRPRGESSMGTT